MTCGSGETWITQQRSFRANRGLMSVLRTTTVPIACWRTNAGVDRCGVIPCWFFCLNMPTSIIHVLLGYITFISIYYCQCISWHPYFSLLEVWDVSPGVLSVIQNSLESEQLISAGCGSSPPCSGPGVNGLEIPSPGGEVIYDKSKIIHDLLPLLSVEGVLVGWVHPGAEGLFKELLIRSWASGEKLGHRLSERGKLQLCTWESKAAAEFRQAVPPQEEWTRISSVSGCTLVWTCLARRRLG